MIIDNWLLLLASPAQCHAGNFHQTFIRKKNFVRRRRRRRKTGRKLDTRAKFENYFSLLIARKKMVGQKFKNSKPKNRFI